MKLQEKIPNPVVALLQERLRMKEVKYQETLKHRRVFQSWSTEAQGILIRGTYSGSQKKIVNLSITQFTVESHKVDRVYKVKPQE